MRSFLFLNKKQLYKIIIKTCHIELFITNYSGLFKNRYVNVFDNNIFCIMVTSRKIQILSPLHYYNLNIFSIHLHKTILDLCILKKHAYFKDDD